MKIWKRYTAIACTCLLLITVSACSLGGEKKDPGQAEQLPASQQQTQPGPSSSHQTIHKKVRLYYPDDDLMKLYYTETDIEVAQEADAPKKALELWIAGPEPKGLTKLIPEDVVVQSVKSVNGVAHVSFSKQLQQANLGGAGEQFLMESIALMMKQFGYPSTQVLIEGNKVESILGHVTADIPFEAPDPEQYSSKSS